MGLSALRGGVAFLTRLPVGGGEREWDAFRATPAIFPLVGYLVGALAALPFTLLSAVSQPGTVAAMYLGTLYLVTGITHADGLADVGDAAVVHGDTARRLDALKDSQTGVGGALALALSVVALALGAFGLATATGSPAVALRIVVAAEVGAKAGMALLACLGTPVHEGLGSAVVAENDAAGLLPVAAVALPAVLVAPSSATPALVCALLSGPAVALLVRRWARGAVGGVSGDALGATNELGRVVGLHAGVVAWTAASTLF
ncbi:adenosylcobinamide-GDP ribazoletransferase [Haloprofundus sp. MHR1]|uniref:adenosylcobinamide-GDP ribazoletransferase n=1 Tax=Haloprofundus sp. MHR1 TaxID=2572921 RepID=UPI0010BEF92B|nr:adenosylcobinamide-GDP ribazoletransferase [Haloprofundus sp. MHR1]QCJ47383.1 adenosylcobinamide-GDP ribazoletransferase [Haloprofundus sp. MHR1]